MAGRAVTPGHDAAPPDALPTDAASNDAAPPDAVVAAPRPTTPGTSRAQVRRVWWVSFVLLSLAGSLWALASPLQSGPDEPAHIFRATSLVRGQLLGEVTERTDNNRLAVEVPSAYLANPGCYAFQPNVPASCLELPEEGGVRTVLTSAARHSPFYYAVAGLPSLVNQSSGSSYAMRIVTAIVSAALLASAVTTLALRGGRVAMAGFLVALTPMVLFVSGLVNPSAPEIAAAIGTWVGGAALGTAAMRLAAHREAHRDSHPDSQPAAARRSLPPRLVWSTAIAASVLVLSRALSPVWLAGIVVVLVILTPWSAIRVIAADHRARGGAALVVVAAGVHLWWLLWARPLAAVDPERTIETDLGGRISGAFWRSIDYPRDMVGNAGWLDTPAPRWVAWLWLAMLVVLLVFGLLAASARQRLAIVAVLAATVVVPVALDAMQAPRTGFIWQGRYTIPVAVGVPLLCGWALATARRPLPPVVGRWLAPLLAVGFVAAHVGMFYTALRRYAVGSEGPMRFLAADLPWVPPLGNLGSLAAYGVVMTVLAGWLVVGAPRRAGVPSGPSASVPPPQRAATATVGSAAGGPPPQHP